MEEEKMLEATTRKVTATTTNRLVHDPLITYTATMEAHKSTWGARVAGACARSRGKDVCEQVKAGAKGIEVDGPCPTKNV